MDNKSFSRYGRLEFVSTRAELAIPCLVIIVLASVIGTFGNFLILASFAKFRKLRTTDSIFIGSLAISDMYVTLVADPMSAVAKLEGEDFFVRLPALCKVIGCLCTVSCVCSLMTIGGMALNRYFHICNYNLYRRLYTTRNVLLMCASFWGVGIILVIANMAGPGDHSFDRKSLECIWDRMASHPFTIVFSVVMVWIPLCLISFSYIRIYLHVLESKRRVHQINGNGISTENALGPNDRPKQTMRDRDNLRALRLAKTLFAIYAVFAVCWLPYALLIALDSKDEYSHELHLIITMTAHLHPSLNFIIYFATNQKFHKAFIDILGPCCRWATRRGDALRSLGSNNRSANSNSLEGNKTTT